MVDVVTKDADGNVISNADYTYDVFDRRIGKSVDADGDGVAEKVERFVNDGDHIALTFDGDGNQTERFLHGARIDEVIASENASGEVLWALTDNLGSVRVLLDNDGNVVNEITYDAFGNITLQTDSDVDFRFSYTGRELDSETGLYNYRYRYYDPAVGQFINEDTIGFAGGDSNLYRYVVNSPVNYIDPFGLFTNGGVQVPTVSPPGTGTTISPSGTSPAIGIPSTNRVDQYRLNTEEQIRKNQYIKKYGDFPGSDNPQLWKDLPGQLPKDEKFDSDPLQMNPEQDNNDFFNPGKPNSWFDKMKDFIEDIFEDNEKKEEDNNSGTCPAPWASNDDNPDPQASNEPQNNGDDSTEGSSQTGEGDTDSDLNGDINPDLSPEFEIIDYDLQKIKGKAEQVKQNSENYCFGGGCDYLADQIEDYLIEVEDPDAGIRIKLDSGNPNGQIIHNETKNVIGTSGFHEGTIINSNGENLVIDPIYTDGISESEWIKKFSTESGEPLNIIKRKLGEK